MEKPMHEKEGMGTLSTDKVQSLKYHFAISAALVARYCIEGGMPVSKYIIKMKLSTAKNMLLYSEYSIAEIAAVFAFSSQSHFTDVFHKFYGQTPLQCRMSVVNEMASSIKETSTVSMVSDGV